MYRFLLTPRWLGFLALALVAATVMVLLGNWQHGRYELRKAVNHRIDVTGTMTPVPLDTIITAGGTTGTPGPGPWSAVEWTRVTTTGEYDPANVVLVRGRTVDNKVGFEIVTPLRLSDGSAVLVDLGWVPAAPGGGAYAQPTVPPIPTGQVTVTGAVKLSESRGTAVDRAEGKLETRRIAVPEIAAELPYPVRGAFVQLDTQAPAADAGFKAVPPNYENDWLNLGYTVQWWLFGAMTLFAFGWAARREARGPRERGDRATPEPELASTA
ncbi:Cytochrome oxidase assembly protein ShyY1 [Asanoa hainanensis]|uniref:SURF1-like protein n=1 Tax=Asanoa hainanensis TaxID=560556 RepID=A0A239PFC7_9ACTN|nr:SURF1 family protein [Asanoa hainanensis]SNT65099.1 Cytochrome oxidase assembly protein ShyY1 [Asanoa hainanensis]